jgi:hypothetical protein
MPLIERKKKPCIQCGLLKFIWAYGRCKECDRKVNSALKKQKKKEKKESISELKKKLDAVFSLWVRHRGSKDGMNTCVCCGVVKPIKELQCAHYFSRRYLALRFHEKNGHPNCVRCNVLLNGNYPAYAKFMIDTYGLEEIEKMDVQKNNIVKLNRFFYENMIQHYTEEVAKLKKTN